MLNAYLAATQNLLQSPGAPSTLYSTANLTTFINTARGQLAGEAECVRFLATISTVIGQRNYQFSALSTGVAATTGISGVFNVRAIRYAVASGYQFVYSRAWEWFDFFYNNNPVPASGAPVDWSQHRQGSAGTSTGSGASGSFYLDPVPDLVYNLTCDACCYPQPLAADGDVEAIPYPFTDAVPYFAAYLALLSAQTDARMADAERFFGYYTTFKDRARQFSNPPLSRSQYEQAVDLTVTNKLGLASQKANG